MSDPNPNPIEAGQPVTSVPTSDLAVTPVTSSATTATGDAGSQPVMPAQEAAILHPSQSADPAAGTGTDGEEEIWAGRYSMLNFLDRIIVRALLTIAVIVLAIMASRSPEHSYLTRLAQFLGVVVVIMWIYLGVRMMRAWYSHYYRLTTRRLFVSSGIVRRRRDMLELLRVNDVTMRQNSLFERWLGLGTVIVLSNEKGAPTFYLPGVRNPKGVLDMIWHYARTERDQRTVKVDHV